MKRAIASTMSPVTLSFVAVSLSVQPAVAATAKFTYPNKIAVIAFENTSFEDLFCSASGFPFGVCTGPGVDQPSAQYLTHWVSDATGGTPTVFIPQNDYEALHSCTVSCPDNAPDGSAVEYAYMTSGDDCAGICTDDNFNRSNFNAKTSVPASSYPNFLGQLDNKGKTWHTYAEDFPGQGQGNCETLPFSDGAAKLEYARKHNPGVFYSDAVTDCESGNPAPVTNFGVGDNGTGAQTPLKAFDGTQNLSKFNFIVPEMCHDAHNGSSLCTPNQSYWDNLSGQTKTCADGVMVTYPGNPVDKYMGADYWLCQNLAGIRASVGNQGVVIVTFDEDCPSSCSPSSGRIPTIVLPGGTGVLQKVGTNTTTYDQASLFKSVVRSLAGPLWNNATQSGSCTWYSADKISEANCSRVAQGSDAHPDTSPLLPIKESSGVSSNIALVQQQGTASAHASTSITATFASATTAGSTLIALVGATQMPTVTAPSGWLTATALNNGSESMFYYPDAPSTSSVTFTFSSSVNSAVQLMEVSGLAGEVDQANTSTSGMGTGTVGDSGPTPTDTEADDEFIVAGITNQSGTATSLDPSTPGWTLVGNVSQGMAIDQATFIQSDVGIGSYEAKGDFTPAAKWRGVIASFE